MTEVLPDLQQATLVSPFLCWIAMGYCMSRQRSLGGYSPYFLLFGRWPIVWASVRDVLLKVVDLDSPAEWARQGLREAHADSVL
jgi:hypothetical protein